MKNLINFVTGTLATTLVYFLGGWDIALQSLLLVMFIDYVTGVCKGIKKKELNSKRGIWGALKKGLYILVVVLATVLDRIMGDSGAIRTLTIYFFVANDGISILENMGGMGVPLPQKIFDVLEQLKNDNDPK